MVDDNDLLLGKVSLKEMILARDDTKVADIYDDEVQSVETSMPVFDGVLSDREIAAALAFIKSTWPVRVLEQQQRISAQSR